METEHTTRLQGIGLVQGKPARDLKEGDIIYWNYGIRSKVLAIVKETEHFIDFALTGNLDTEKRKESYTRRLKKDRIVASK